MRKTLYAGLVLAVLMGMPALAAASTITWILSPNIALTDGGVLNGEFTLNSAGYLNGNYYNLTTTAGSLVPGYSYTTAINGSDPNNLTVQFFGPNYTSMLNLEFEYSLLTPNLDNPILGGLGGPSYECGGYSCNVSDERYVGLDAGFASATPLPASLPLFAAGAGLIGGLVARRRKKQTRLALAAP